MKTGRERVSLETTVAILENNGEAVPKWEPGSNELPLTCHQLDIPDLAYRFSSLSSFSFRKYQASVAYSATGDEAKRG